MNSPFKPTYYIVELNKTIVGFHEIGLFMTNYIKLKPTTINNQFIKVSVHKALNYFGYTILKFDQGYPINDASITKKLDQHYAAFDEISRKWTGLERDGKLHSWIKDSLYCPETCRRYNSLAEAVLDISPNDTDEERAYTYERLLHMIAIQYHTHMIVTYLGFHLITIKLFKRVVKYGLKYLNEISSPMNYNYPIIGDYEFQKPLIDRTKDVTPPNPILSDYLDFHLNWDIPDRLQPYSDTYLARIYNDASDMLCCHPNSAIYIDDAWKANNLHCTVSVKCDDCGKEVYLPISAKEFYRINNKVLGKRIKRDEIEDPYA